MDKSNAKGDRKSFKVIVLGEAGVGKSSLIRRYTRGYFSSQTTTTVGVDRVPIKVAIDNDLIDFQVLDAAGCFAFHGLIKSYVNNVDAVIFVYDVTNKETFACLPLWNSIMRNSRNKDNLVQILVGNKRDLAPQREVNFKNAKHYADFEGMVAMEVSVKEAKGVDLVFQSVARELRMKNKSMKNSVEENMAVNFPLRPQSALGRSRDTLLRECDSGQRSREEGDKMMTSSRHFTQRFRTMFNSKEQRKGISFSKSDSMLSLSAKQPLDEASCSVGTGGYTRQNYLRWF